MADKKSLENGEDSTVKEKAPQRKKASCSTHPDRPAKHTTSSTAFWPISLCDDCLRASPHMADL